MEIFGSVKLFWFALGFVFLILEVLTPGIVFLFFGLGSWLVLLLLLAFDLPMGAQWGVFTVVSVLLLLTLRKHVTRLFSSKKTGRADSLQEPMVAGSYIGRIVEIVEDVSPDKPGLAELNGTNWRATSLVDLPKGARAKIKEVRDLTLEVEPLPKLDPAG
jgi:membrane protein implicated in regulation of membrane protease activity